MLTSLCTQQLGCYRAYNIRNHALHGLFALLEFAVVLNVLRSHKHVPFSVDNSRPAMLIPGRLLLVMLKLNIKPSAIQTINKRLDA